MENEKQDILLKAPSGFSSYHWQDGSINETLLINAAGNYRVIVTDNNGCLIKDSISVNIFPQPKVDIGNDPEICRSPIATLDAGSGFNSYLWQDGSVNSKIIITQPGNYWVQVKDNNNCIAADTLRVTGFKNAPENFLAATAELCNARTLTINAVGIWEKYLWFNNTTSASTTIAAPGKYWLQVTNSEGCTAKDSIMIVASDCAKGTKGIFFPNAFTPDNDNKNDTYKPVVNGQLVKFKMSIYNRFGEKVFETTDCKKGWDGKYADKKQDTHTFAWFCIYQLQGEPEKMAKGTVTLIR